MELKFAIGKVEKLMLALPDSDEMYMALFQTIEAAHWFNDFRELIAKGYIHPGREVNDLLNRRWITKS